MKVQCEKISGIYFDIFNFKQLVHLKFGHIMMRKRQQYYQTDIISLIEFSLDTRADWCVILYVIIFTFSASSS